MKIDKWIKHINRKWVAIIFLFFVGWFFLVHRYIDMELVKEYIALHPFRAPFLLILLKAGTVLFAPLSGTVVYATAGVLFPFREAFLYIVVGNILWMTGAFYLGRWYGDKVIIFIFWEKWDKKAHHLIDRLGNVEWLAIARIVLFPLEDLINYVAGITKISYWSFVTISTTITSLWVLPWLFGVDTMLGRIWL